MHPQLYRLRARRSRVGEVEEEEYEEPDDGEERTSTTEEVDGAEDHVAEEDEGVADSAEAAAASANSGRGATVIVERSLGDGTATPFPVRRKGALLLPLAATPSTPSSARNTLPERDWSVVVAVLVLIGGFSEVTAGRARGGTAETGGLENTRGGSYAVADTRGGRNGVGG